MNNSLVSIGIPTYNRPDFLRKTLKSILEQTYKNIEVIVSDDCFPGKENKELCEEFIEKGLNIKYYRPETNLGGPLNHKTVLELSTGEYFSWISDDDIFNKNFVELGLESLTNNLNYHAWIPSFVNINKNEEVIRKYPGMARFKSGEDKLNDLLKFIFEPESFGKAVPIVCALFRAKSLKAYCKDHFWNNNNHWSDAAFVFGYYARFDVDATNDILIYKGILEEEPNKEIPYIMSELDYAGVPINKTVNLFTEYFKSAFTIKQKILLCFAYPVKILIDCKNHLLRKLK